MKVFKLSKCNRFLKVFFFTITCQIGELSSQDFSGPQNGQWPVYTRNEWEEDSSHFNSEPSRYDWNTFQDLSIQPEELPPSPQNIEKEQSNFSSSLPPKQPGSDKENLVNFIAEIEQEKIHEEKKPSTLLEGKGNVTVIKKHPDPIASMHHLEEALHQTEDVIGKVNIHDSHVAILEDVHNENAQKKEKTIKQEAELVAHPPLLPHSSVLPTTRENEIVQNTDRATTPPLPILNDPLTPKNVIESPRSPAIITPTAPSPEPVNQTQPKQARGGLKEISINFNNVAMVEYIRFISRISNKNFIFDEEDLQFNVTIVSEEPTTIDNLMAALLQELRIRDLALLEQGNNILIHRNPRVRAPARIVSDDSKLINAHDSELVTRVFRLNTLDPVKASEIIRPLLSDDALIEVLKDSNNLIITDLVANINKISQLISSLDSPNSGVTIGQYVVRNAFVDSLVDLANKILQPIAQGNPFVLVPHPVSNSIFIVSNSFIVEKALAILQNLDHNEGKTKILNLETLHPSYEAHGMQGSSQGRTPAGSISGNYEPGRIGSIGPNGEFIPGSIGPNGEFIRGNLGPNGTFIPVSIGPNGEFIRGSIGPNGEFIPGTSGGIGSAGGLNTGSDRGSLGGFGPGGQFTNQQAVPESFPLDGLSAEGRINTSSSLPLSSFIPGGLGAEGKPSAIFDETRSFLPGGIGSASRWSTDLPVGHIERTLFFIYKLRYRKGDGIEIALRKIANSLQLMGTANVDLISAINSSQWIESSNALIFTGTALALEKVRELILEIDVPLRQVFIEMLILDTTIEDSLNFSVDWINRFGGGTTTGEQGFFEATPGSGIASADKFLQSSETIFSSGSVVAPASAQPLPVATGFLNSGGFAAGIIGTHLTHNGTRFSSLGALVRAIHHDVKADIILNPKIITEDNNPAEIFVGGTDRYKTQSITNDLGSLVTNNFQFIDVGTTLRVTPLIGNNGIITLEIVQETTNEAATANAPGSGNNQNVNLVPVLTKTRTVTKVHVPNGFFVVLSGMIKDNEIRSYARIPCLGGIPIIGCVGKTQVNSDNKRNLMLFIRPLILDTDDDYEDVTKRQQDVFREKSKFRRSWNYEVDEGMSFANIRPLDPDDMNCQCNERQQP